MSPAAQALGVQKLDRLSLPSIAAEIVKSGELIQQCMLERGFEYRVPPKDAVSFGGLVGGGLSDEEFASTYGLGVSPSYVSTLGGVGPPALADVQRDPNDEILQSLEGEERRQWYLALWGYEAGPAPIPRDEGADDFGSCNAEAAEAVAEVQVLVEPILLVLDGVDVRVSADPRMAAAERVWSRCMGERGHSFASERAMRDHFFEELQKVRAEALRSDGGDSSHVTGIEAGGSSVEKRLAEALDPLAKREIEAAIANLECDGPRRAVYELVRFEVEQALVDENIGLFAEIGASLGT